jgi:hypothetical protein
MSNHCPPLFGMLLSLVRIQCNFGWVFATASFYIASVFFLKPTSAFSVAPFDLCVISRYNFPQMDILDLHPLFLFAALIQLRNECILLKLEALSLCKQKLEIFLRIEGEGEDLHILCVCVGYIIETSVVCIHALFLLAFRIMVLL